MSQALTTITPAPAPSPAPLSPYAHPKACMGYVSQNEAVIALYEAGCEPKLIAQRASIPINSVHRVVSIYRRQTGRLIAPRIFQMTKAQPCEQHHPMWDMEEARRRLAIMARAQAGARKTRMEKAGL